MSRFYPLSDPLLHAARQSCVSAEAGNRSAQAAAVAEGMGGPGASLYLVLLVKMLPQPSRCSGG